MSVWPGVCAPWVICAAGCLRGWVSARTGICAAGCLRGRRACAAGCLRGRVSARLGVCVDEYLHGGRNMPSACGVPPGQTSGLCADRIRKRSVPVCAKYSAPFFCTQNASPLCILTDLSSIISDPRTKCKRRHHLFPFFTRGLPTRQHAFRGFPSGAAQDDGCRCILSLTAWRRRSILTALFRRPCALIIEPAFPLVNPNILHKITSYCVFSSPGQKYIAVFP